MKCRSFITKGVIAFTAVTLFVSTHLGFAENGMTSGHSEWNKRERVLVSSDLDAKKQFESANLLADSCVEDQRRAGINRRGAIQKGPYANPLFKGNCMDPLYAFLALRPKFNPAFIYARKLRSQIDSDSAKHQLLHASSDPLVRFHMRQRIHVGSLMDAYIIQWDTHRKEPMNFSYWLQVYFTVDDVYARTFGEKIKSSLSNIGMNALIGSRGYGKNPNSMPLEKFIYHAILGHMGIGAWDAIGRKEYRKDDDFWNLSDNWFGKYHNLENIDQVVANELRNIATHFEAWKAAERSINYVATIISDGATLIDYVKFEHWNEGKKLINYGAFILKKSEGGKPSVRFYDLGSSEVIDSAIQSVRNGISSVTSMQSLRVHTKQLYALLINPFAEDLKARGEIIIEPDGKLYLLPFEILQDHSNAYIGDSYTISYTSIEHLIGNHLLDRWVPKSKKTNPGIIIASPNYDYGTKPVASNLTSSEYAAIERLSVGEWPHRYTPLGYTKEEGKMVRSLAKNDSVLLSWDNAREFEIAKRAKPKFLHIASHGYFLEKAMIDWNASMDSMPLRGLRSPSDEMQMRIDPYLQSGMALTGFNRLIDRVSISQFEDDGILTGSEIRRFDLRGTELVVLSACETGLAVVNTGKNVAGLRSAFLSTGVENVVMSLWNVSDEWTYKLMESFYRHYLTGTSPSKALKVARMEVRKERKKAGWSDHPYYWAAFVIAKGR